MKKRMIFSSIVSIVLCLMLTCGATFALFTSEDKVNIAVNSGTVKVDATINETFKTWSRELEMTGGAFANGGNAELVDGTLKLNKMTPLDKVEFKVDIANGSNVAVQYRLRYEATGELVPALEVSAKIDDADSSIVRNGKTRWNTIAANEAIPSIVVTVYFPEGDDPATLENEDNAYQDKSALLTFTVEAIQGNANVSDWDGTANISWFTQNLDESGNFTLNEVSLSTPEQLAGLAQLVDGKAIKNAAAVANGETPDAIGAQTFDGVTFTLEDDISLKSYDEDGNLVSFDPIGYGYGVPFTGTFDGKGHTISNLYQNGWELGLDYSTEGGGLFASVVDTTIKNLTIDNSSIEMECIDMGTLVGYSYGTCTYENITISNSYIANYNRYTGGVVGEVNGTQTFKNVDVVDSVVSAMWGTYDASVGGIIGGKWGDADITFEDCDVNCQLDVFNDACANYQYYNYRLSGMLIGMSEEVTDGVATASYLTCTNCTVTYGEWMNYTYCEFEANGSGSYNKPGEWKFSRVQAGMSTGGVNPNHTHDTDESHEVLLAFDQLFGGDKGVKGGKTHPGVTVNYPASYNPNN